ncbi:MAG: ATP-dependent DNA helicase RecG [Clostridiales bacterium]|jgi:ATP-dependent DNA helicase RecG|nr:ATP-dependent DNA helicase RecG [Clostridiales bacterium]
MRLSDPVSRLPGVGEKRYEALRGAGIRSVGDLLNHFPRDYDDRSQVKTVSMLIYGAVNTLRGHIAAEPENISFPRKNAGASGKPLIMTKARLRDETGELELIWFNQPYLKRYFKKDTEYVFTGKVDFQYGRARMESPEYDCGESVSSGRVVPVYTAAAKGISQKFLRSAIHAALKNLDSEVTDDLPACIREKFNFFDRKTAVYNIHFPESDGHFLHARRRLVFEELFFMQLALFALKNSIEKEDGETFINLDLKPLLDSFPFRLTNAQFSVLETIKKDLSRRRRMNRLIQGDVGSGKTAVAIAACFLAAQNGYQAAIMAPTEVLAAQHYGQFSRYFAPFGFHTVLLTGSMTRRERSAALAEIAEGRAQMIVGTHALIQTGVEYRRLAMVITDEQHRFGVNQRFTLTYKGSGSALLPHTLVMTATPIPRTLGLILYGDMDVSSISEMPPGRIPIKTYSVNSSYRARLHAFMQKEIAQGRQVYVICPSIEEKTAEDGGDSYAAVSKAEVANVAQYTRELSRALPGMRVACLHGRMKPLEKQQIMDAFKAGEIKALVSTTVIEVGVHVANASLMIIENAERFGLSQLHQLRGRVGRGNHQSYCVLVSDVRNNERTRARMRAMTKTCDGFALSEMDLEQRGAGDFFGVKQHGLPSFTIANLYRDMDILKEAQETAVQVRGGEIAVSEAETERIRLKIRALFGAYREAVL